MDYKIVYGVGARDLENAVTDHIKHGWRPKGGISVVHYESSAPRFAQAMTRKALMSAKAVQAILAKLGHNPGKQDGKWPPYTLAALNKLRSTLKLAPVKKYEHSSDALLRQLK